MYEQLLRALKENDHISHIIMIFKLAIGVYKES